MKKIERNNRLIAEFMEFESFQDSRYGELWDHPSEKGSSFELKYDSSWNWLMPVVKEVYIKTHSLDYEGTISKLTIFAKIDMVYAAVIEFIKWYNKNKTNP